jgi:hypothetical protein
MTSTVIVLLIFSFTVVLARANVQTLRTTTDLSVARLQHPPTPAKLLLAPLSGLSYDRAAREHVRRPPRRQPAYSTINARRPRPDPDPHRRRRPAPPRSRHCHRLRFLPPQEEHNSLAAFARARCCRCQRSVTSLGRRFANPPTGFVLQLKAGGRRIQANVGARLRGCLS